jgi:hypothetical protein
VDKWKRWAANQELLRMALGCFSKFDLIEWINLFQNQHNYSSKEHKSANHK